MSEQWTYRLIALAAILGPFGFWAVNLGFDRDWRWEWGLLIPAAIAIALVVRWRRGQAPKERSVQVMTVIAVSFWLVTGIVSAFNEGDNVPTRPFPTPTPVRTLTS